MKTRQRLGALICAGMALAVLPAAASAASITYEGDTLVYRAGPEQNYVQVEPGEDPGTIAISDSATTASHPPDRCAASEWSGAITCQAPGAMRFELGDGRDQSTLGYDFPASIPVDFHGQGGDDILYVDQSGGRNENVVTLDGGDGNDELVGSQGRDVLRGGPGNDELLASGDADVLEGGAGNDRLRPDVGCTRCGEGSRGADVVDGGPGTDILDDWAGVGAAIAISLDGAANDGLPGEGDNIGAVEEVRAHVSGTYLMSDAAEYVYVSSSAEQGLTTVKGYGGDDKLEGENQREDLDGGAGDDFVEGGFGDDVLTGGPGRDTIVGDQADAQCGGYGQSCTQPFGNDTIHARDGEADSISCGPGNDRVYADAIDTVADDCETVERSGGGPGGGDGAGGGGGPGGGDGSGACVVPKVKRGSKLKAAKKKVAAAGCAVKVKRVRSRAIAKGRVVGTSPKAGKTLAAGATVTLKVSRGRR